MFQAWAYHAFLALSTAQACTYHEFANLFMRLADSSMVRAWIYHGFTDLSMWFADFVYVFNACLSRFVYDLMPGHGRYAQISDGLASGLAMQIL